MSSDSSAFQVALRYQASPISWYTPIDVYPDTNPDPSISTWKMGISYHDPTTLALKYAEYKCSDKSCYWKIYTVDSAPNPGDLVGRYTSLKFDYLGIPNVANQSKVPDSGFADVLVYLNYAYLVGGGAGTGCNDNNWQCNVMDMEFQSWTGLYNSIGIGWDDTIYIAFSDADNLYYASSVCSGNNALIPRHSKPGKMH